MRLIVLSVMGLMAGLGLAAAIVSFPVMAEKGPLRDTLVADLGGAQEELPGGGDPDGRGRAVVKVFEEQLCGRVKTSAIESSSSTKATINLGMSGEKGPTVANLQEERAATPTTGTTTGTTAGTTGTTTGTTGTTTGTTGTITGTTGTTTPTTDTTTATAGTTTGAQTGTTTTTTGDTTLAQATTEQSTTLAQTSPSQSTASPTASASASASAASPSADTILEHTGGCVEVPRALSLELLEHPRRYYVNLTNEQYPEGAIKGQLHRSADHRSGEHRSGDADDD